MKGSLPDGRLMFDPDGLCIYLILDLTISSLFDQARLSACLD